MGDILWEHLEILQQGTVDEMHVPSRRASSFLLLFSGRAGLKAAGQAFWTCGVVMAVAIVVTWTPPLGAVLAGDLRPLLHCPCCPYSGPPTPCTAHDPLLLGQDTYERPCLKTFSSVVQKPEHNRQFKHQT